MGGLQWFGFRILLALLCTFSLSLITGTTAFAAGGSTGGSPRFDFRQKIERKEGARWTLQEWLAQKQRNQLMDLWLGMYAPSPYEFSLSGGYQSYTTSTEPLRSDNSHQSYSGAVAAYATLIGLQAEYENNSQEVYNDLSGSLNIRIIGNAVQGTHVILFAGLRTRTIDNSGTPILLRNKFIGADLNLYLTKYFGLAGNYRSYLPTDDTTLGTVSGTRSEAGIFIDFAAIRIFGNYFIDKQIETLSGVNSSVERTGIQSGIKFFF